jgi:hypothetical protein
MLNAINEIKTLLLTLNDFKNVKIGIEKGISAKDVPFIRISPISSTSNSIRQNLEYIIYVGIKKNANSEQNFIDIANHSNTVINLLNRIEICGGLNMLESIELDDDRLDNLKMSALRFKLDEYYGD